MLLAVTIDDLTSVIEEQLLPTPAKEWLRIVNMVQRGTIGSIARRHILVKESVLSIAKRHVATPSFQQRRLGLLRTHLRAV